MPECVFLLHVRHGSVSLALTDELLSKHSAFKLRLSVHIVHQLTHGQSCPRQQQSFHTQM